MVGLYEVAVELKNYSAQFIDATQAAQVFYASASAQYLQVVIDPRLQGAEQIVLTFDWLMNYVRVYIELVCCVVV